MPGRGGTGTRVMGGTPGAIGPIAGLSLSRCVGWLLRANRRLAHGRNRAFRSGAEFARAFRRDAGRPLAASQITRWENGDLPVGMATIRRYEQLLERPAGSLQSAIDLLSRTYGHRPRVEPATEADEDRLEGLLDLIRQNATMTGQMWGELTRIIASRPGMYLYPRTLWKTISENLLRELVIAEGESWLHRQESFSRLLEHPVASRYAIASCIEVIEDSSSPAFIEPLSLLEITDGSDANRYVLRQLTDPASDRALHGALLASIRKVQDGHFLGEDWIRLVNGVRAVVADESHPPAIPPLIAEVGRGLRRRGMDPAALGLRLPGGPDRQPGWTVTPGRSPGGAWSVTDGSPPGPPRATSARIARMAQALLADGMDAPDDVLVHLTEEALHSAHPDKRLAATMAIAATPYREPIGQAVLVEVGVSLARREDEFCASALRTLTNLGADCHRPLIRDILLRSGSSALLRDAAASALPHCAGGYSPAQWRLILGPQRTAWLRQPSRLAQSILHGVTYGIGTDGHHDLLREIRGDVRLPALVRTTANWLLNNSDPPR